MSRLFELHASKICSSLHSEDKKKRLKALEKLDNIVTNNENNWNECELSEIWKIINKYITKNVSDESELCRNLSIDITKKFLEVLPVDEKNIIFLVPVLKRRLGSQEIHEESEEVRLNCVILIKLIIRIYKKYLSIYHNDFITILSRTVIDSYPKIKKESCESISQLAENIPLKFYYKSNYVIKPILTNFTHQHYRVRVASVNAIGQVMLYGNSKNMNEVSTPMAERLFDQSGAVRLAVIQVAGMWLIKLHDRYSWWNKLIPIILTGLHDEILEIREKAEKLWSAAGHHYLEENYNDDKIKNKMDFLTLDPKHYPPSIKRPNLGCRVIVQRNISHLVGGIAKDLNDWLPDIRVRSAQLLAVLVLNAEEDITQHIHKLLPAMYRACNDEDKRVIVNVVIAAEYIGHFVLPETYCKLVLPTLNEGNISSGHLSVFSAIIRGSKKEQLTNKLKDIGRFLQEHNICRSKKSVYQQELLISCDAILSVCQENSSVIAEELFEIIFTVWSMAQQQKIENYSKKLLNDLSLMTNNKNIEDLFENHIRSILNMLKNSSTTLTVFSPEFYIFNNCLKNTKIATSKNIDLVMPILKITMDKDSLDFELRLKMLILLSEYFQQRSKSLNNIEKLNSFFGDFLDNILIPNLIWKAGRSAESVRTSAMSCLCALLDNEDNANNHPIFSNADKFVEYFNKLKPIIMSLTSDNSKKTRLFSLKGIYILLKYAMKLVCVSDEDVIEIYPEIIKRLDDGCDDVRFVAIEVLVFVFQALSCNYDLDFGRSHIDYLYTSTVIHLDDPEEKFQNIMLDAIIQLAKIHPKLLYDKIEKCKINFRNQQALEKIQKECQGILCFEKVTLE